MVVIHTMLKRFFISGVLGLLSAVVAAQAQAPADPPAAASATAAAELTVASASEGAEQTDPAVHHPQAKSVPLDQPVIIEKPRLEEVVEPAPETDAEKVPAAGTQPADTTQQPAVHEPLVILNTEVPPSTTTRLSWSPSHSMEGIATPTPVLIVNGAGRGPVLCLTAAIHGDELNGIEIVRRVLYNLDPGKLAGTVVGVPIVNLQGFHRSSRYLTDRRDLNRFFPGNPEGSSAARIAHSFFHEVISHCDALVDLHTGSFHRTNMPQLRADLRDPQVVQLTQGFGGTVVLQSEGAAGTLRRAAVDSGIPAVTLEAGEPMRLQEKAVEQGVSGITTLMSKMGMIDRFSFWGDPEPVYYHSEWIRADQGGILFSNVELGETVEKGDLLGEVTDPITNIKSGIVSPLDGRVIGMALNQVVLPGFAAFHIAIQAPKGFVKKLEATQRAAGDIPAGGSDDASPDASESVGYPDIRDVDGDLSETSDTDDSD